MTSSATGLRLGSLVLGELLGKGGLGEVYRAQHERSGAEVAVKVVRADRRERAGAAAFRREVEAAARLEHPGIVRVLDYGEVEPDDAYAALSGSPYIVMELVRGESLRAACGRLRWNALRDALAQVLHALAHAHARGVIHRDLKPDNILRDSSGRLMLVDFGIAHALDHDPEGVSGLVTAGTPAFMAPEQFEGRVRDYGPWTDLYALGATAYALATGLPPFGRGRAEELASRHLTARAAPPVGPEDQPPDFAPWLLTLLEKDVADRYAYAADALHTLPAADPAGQGGWTLKAGALRSEERTVTWQPPTSDLPTQAGSSEAVAPPRAPATPGGSDRPAPRRAPPPPDAWDAPVPGHAERSPGAELRLFGLRSTPLVGRIRERDALWAALHEVARNRKPVLVLLRGAAGTGKSRLARWLTERAHEVGAAHVLRATHGAIPGPRDGVPFMLADHLRCAGLTPTDALARVAIYLRGRTGAPAHEWGSVVSLMRAALDTSRDDPVGARFSSEEERHVALATLLRRLTADRPAVMWLDDIHAGADSLGFVSHLLKQQEPRPVPALLVLTARDEGLAEHPVEASQLDDLVSLPGARLIEVGPMPSNDHAELLRQLLGVRGDLVRRLMDRTAGNPLFAVGVVTDWVRRGALEPTAEGLALRPGHRVELPADLLGFWSVRLAETLRGRDASFRDALTVAAALGTEVDGEEWRAACAELGATAADELVEALVRRALVQRREDGFAFVHAMIPASIEELAGPDGGWRAAHRACVAMLRARGRHEPERIGRHLLAAGEQADAVRPLLDGVRGRLRVGDAHGAMRLLDLVEGALASVPEDQRVGLGAEHDVLRGRTLGRLGRFRDMRRPLLAALRGARRAGDRAMSGWALSQLGMAAIQAGRVRRGELLKRAALACFEETDEPLGVLEALWGIAACARDTGRLDEAEQVLSRGMELSQRVGDPVEQADCFRGLSQVAVRRGDYQAARAHDERALMLYREAGYRLGELYASNGIGEAARFAGDPRTAETYYRRALEVATSLGTKQGIPPRNNLALLLAQEGEHAEALALLDDVLVECERVGWGAIACGVHAWRMACAAGLGDMELFDSAERATRDGLGRSLRNARDVASGAEQAARLCAERSEHDRGVRARALALEVYRTLGDEEACARMGETSA